MCGSGWGFWPVTRLSPTSGTSLKAEAAAADCDIDKTLQCSGRKIPPTPIHPTPPFLNSPRPGDLLLHPLPTSPQPASWAPSPCQETTNTNPFPEGRSQNQLLGVVFTNKAVLWGLRLRLGVESKQSVWYTLCIMASTFGNLGNHLSNARLQRWSIKIRLLLSFQQSSLQVGYHHGEGFNINKWKWRQTP